MNHILFDLDGTVIDPKIGILNCIHFALEQMGRVPASLGSLEWCIGPPLLQSFEKIFADKTQAQEAVAFFRRRYATEGLRECHTYDGIVPLLFKLKNHSKTLFVATSKPSLFATQIIQNLNLDVYFKGIYGSELDGTNSEKGQLIAHLLRSEKLNPSDCVMIGDREHDIFGGQHNQVKSLGVGWGYGSPQELACAGAEKVFSSPAELGHYLLAGKTGFQGA